MENKKNSEIVPAAFKQIPIHIEEEMRSSYIDYAMSVIVGRALPDARDGLKPVHRRILYSMNEQGMVFGKPYKKSARVVGDVLGKYHPHGDIAIYDSMVRMAQEFSLRYPLIDGQGNFGSVDGDSAAAMRYTEARTSKIAAELLTDIDKETVDFAANFDESTVEPVVLPAKLPNLLLNGSAGIAVGMATNIPPHNLNELVAGICALVDNPDITNKGLMKFVKGPDFPTGGIICGDEGIKSTYETGKGALPIRSKVSIEEFKKDRQAIIVHEIPYQVNKASLIVRIAELVQEKKITGISDLRDESGRQGMRIFIEIKKGVNPSIVLNQLFKLSSLQTSFNCNMLALIDGEPKLCNLKTLLEEFVKFRFEVITRRTKYDLRKAEERAHILEGILIALDNLDEVIKLIRGSKDAEAARNGLMKSFKMSEIQAQAILDIRLQRLTAMESLKIREEHKEVMALIKELKEILGSKKKISELIKTESQKLAEDHGDARRTEIQGAVTEVNVEELIPQDEVAVFITLQGYVKRLPVQTFRAQMRGGRGITGMATRDTDVIEKIYVCSTHSTLMCFTNLGKACGFKVYDIPDASRQSKGQHLANLLELADGETVSSAIAIEKFDPKQFLMMATKQGVIKKTQLSEFETNRKSGIIAISLDKGDELVFTQLSDGNKEVLLGTRDGLLIRFKEKDVRPMGRSAQGVRGIDLREGDALISMETVENAKDEVLVISEKGYGKRTPLDEYKSQSRGGKGVKAMTVKPEKTGFMARFRVVNAEDEVMFVSSNGTVSKQLVKNISIQHRAASGVIIQRMSAPTDKIVDMAKVLKVAE